MTLKKGAASDVGMSPAKVQHLAYLAQRWVNEGVTSGVVVLVARKGTIVFEESFGQIAPDRHEPPRSDTLFTLGSATTLLTITAAMALVEDGLLGLNRPVSSYLPEFRGEGNDKIMVHHLLRHASGLRDEEVGYPNLRDRNTSAPANEFDQHPKIQEYLESKYETSVLRPPDTEMSYGHFTIELLGEVIRRVAGKPLPEFCDERIFAPLGMGDTGFTVPAAEQHRLVERPPDAPHAELISLFKDNEVPWASFSGVTSPRDMCVFGQMFLDGGRFGDVRVLSRATVAEMTRNQVPGLSAQYRDEHIPEATWGLGWNLHGNKRALGDGTLQSSQAYYQGNSAGPIVWVDPTHEIVGVYFSAALKLIADEWPGDLFMNAVTAAVEEVD